MRQWLLNIFDAVATVAHAMWVSMRYWVRTYDPKRRTFTEHYEYPELPLKMAPRFRGFHRYDSTVCTSCSLCASVCPADCIYVGREKIPGKKGFKVTSFVIDYTKCMFCALCVEVCPMDTFAMGSTHDLSCYSRDGCSIDFLQLPVEVARGEATLNPMVLAHSRVISQPVSPTPEQCDTGLVNIDP